MSRVGKLPVNIPDNIKIAINNDVITFDSGKTKKTYKISKGVNIEFSDKQIKLIASKDAPTDISKFVGMDRSNIKNIVVLMSQKVVFAATK